MFHNALRLARFSVPRQPVRFSRPEQISSILSARPQPTLTHIPSTPSPPYNELFSAEASAIRNPQQNPNKPITNPRKTTLPLSEEQFRPHSVVTKNHNIYIYFYQGTQVRQLNLEISNGTPLQATMNDQLEIYYNGAPLCDFLAGKLRGKEVCGMGWNGMLRCEEIQCVRVGFVKSLEDGGEVRGRGG